MQGETRKVRSVDSGTAGYTVGHLLPIEVIGHGGAASNSGGIGRRMSRSILALTAVGLLWLAAPTTARAESFDSFCAEWMNKLAAREQANLKKMEYTPKSGGVVGSYTGYEKVPIRCQSRAKP